MAPYTTKDLPSAGREGVSLSTSLRKTVSMDVVSHGSFSDTDSNGPGIPSRSTSPGSRVLRKSVSDNGKDSSSASAFRGSASEDNVFVENEPSETQGNDVQAEPESNVAMVVREAPPVDPQGNYTPDACIFVANLSQGYNDVTLHTEVSKIFREYGPVYVKIKRDRRHMPFAFCQFTQVAEARVALAHGHRRLILGRHCRTERCKANVTFLVCKKSGEPIGLFEAYGFLQRFGSIFKVEHLDRESQIGKHLPPAVIVVYEFFDARRDVIKSVGNHPVYMVMPHDPDHEERWAHPDQRNDIFMFQYHKDRRSVFIGNLPPCTTEDPLRLFISPFGRVVEVQLRQNTIPQGIVVHFAFVEFESPEIAENVVTHCNGGNFQGNIIRVEKKKCKAPMDPLHAFFAKSSNSSRSFHPRGASASRSSLAQHSGSSSASDPWSTPSTAVVLHNPTVPPVDERYPPGTPSTLVHHYPEIPVSQIARQFEARPTYMGPTMAQARAFVASLPQPAAQALQPAVQAPQPAVQAPQPAVQAPQPAVQAPQPAVQAPQPAVQAPQPAVQAPQPAVQATATPTRPSPAPGARPAALREQARRTPGRSPSYAAAQAAERAEQVAERAEQERLRRATSFQIVMISESNLQSSDEATGPSEEHINCPNKVVDSSDKVAGSSEEATTSTQKTTASPQKTTASPQKTNKSPQKAVDDLSKDAKCADSEAAVKEANASNNEASTTENESQAAPDSSMNSSTHFMPVGQPYQPYYQPYQQAQAYSHGNMPMMPYMQPSVGQGMHNGMVQVHSNMTHMPAPMVQMPHGQMTQGTPYDIPHAMVHGMQNMPNTMAHNMGHNMGHGMPLGYSQNFYPYPVADQRSSYAPMAHHGQPMHTFAGPMVPREAPFRSDQIQSQGPSQVQAHVRNDSADQGAQHGQEAN